MDSLLRDLNREKSKMQTDVDNLFRHYGKLQDYVHQYIQQTTTEWAKLVLNHPQSVVLIVETTRIVDENGNATYGNQNEPIRFTALQLVTNSIWDLLLRPTHSLQVTGTEYHGLTMADVENKPTVSEAWPEIQDMLENRHVIIFGAEWARLALQPAYNAYILNDAFCLHNKCKEYYNEFYELSLEKVLSYQGIEKDRKMLTDSRDRVLMLAMVIQNLAQGMSKQSQEDDSLNDLDDHPF